jgi:hypothetical protein
MMIDFNSAFISGCTLKWGEKFFWLNKSGVGKSSADDTTRGWGAVGQGVVGSFGMDSVLLRESSILDPSYEIGE